MKANYLVFAIALIVFIFAGIKFIRVFQNKTATVIKQSQDVEVMSSPRFAKTIINVGSKKLNEPVKVNFVIYNDGITNLFIKSVEPDCRCTVGDFSRGAILPGDSSLIRLQYDAAMPGAFQSSASVITSASASPTLLVFRGFIQD